MPEKNVDLDDIRSYFDDKLQRFGTTPQGVDYNSPHSQEHRFRQLIRIINTDQPFSILDFGSGYGSLYGYLLRSNIRLTYYGFDILESMVETGRETYHDHPECHFTSSFDDIPMVDYAVASGTFNMKMGYLFDDWQAFVLENIHKMDAKTTKGFSFNLLTKYSDPEFMRDDLYYADPCFYFDYCKRCFSKNVALLHDYGLYDFTILVRKNL